MPENPDNNTSAPGQDLPRARYIGAENVMAEMAHHVDQFRPDLLPRIPRPTRTHHRRNTTRSSPP